MANFNNHRYGYNERYSDENVENAVILEIQNRASNTGEEEDTEYGDDLEYDDDYEDGEENTEQHYAAFDNLPQEDVSNPCLKESDSNPSHQSSTNTNPAASSTAGNTSSPKKPDKPERGSDPINTNEVVVAPGVNYAIMYGEIRIYFDITMYSPSKDYIESAIKTLAFKHYCYDLDLSHFYDGVIKIFYNTAITHGEYRVACAKMIATMVKMALIRQ